MRETQFFTPIDFDTTSSEEELALHWGCEPDRCFLWSSNLENLLHSLGVEMVHLKQAQGWGIVESPVPDLEVWKRDAQQLLHLPVQPAVFDLSFVEQGWVGHRSWDEVVLVGTGQGQWVVIHWSTSA